jgi:hypothetical protein
VRHTAGSTRPMGACRNSFLGVFFLFLARIAFQSSFFSESRSYSAHINCPFFRAGVFSHLSRDISHFLREKLFSRHIIPTIGSPQKQAEERRREATIIFPPPPNSAGSDALPRRRPSPGDDALCAVAPLQPHLPCPPLAPLSGLATANARRRFYTAVVDTRPPPSA